MNGSHQLIEERIREVLDDALTLAGDFTGCARRAQWSEGPRWQDIRGHSLLSTIGTKRNGRTPAGPLEVFLYDGYLLQFRGGPYRQSAVTDMIDLWCLAWTYIEPLSPEIILLQENKGKLDIHVVPVPKGTDPQARADAGLADHISTPPGRISKATPEAAHICKSCPVRARCNAQDISDGNTSDWSYGYRKNLS